MTTAERSTSAAANHLTRFAGEEVVIGNAAVSARVAPGVEGIENRSGGHFLTHQFTLIVSKSQLPERPLRNARVQVRGGIFHVSDFLEESGHWSITVERKPSSR